MPRRIMQTEAAAVILPQMNLFFWGLESLKLCSDDLCNTKHVFNKPIGEDCTIAVNKTVWDFFLQHHAGLSASNHAKVLTPMKHNWTQA